MSYVYLSHKALPELIGWLKNEGHTPIIMQDSQAVYPAVSSHADLFVCRLGMIAASPLFASAPTERDYPGCAALCAATNDRYFIHNIKITHPALLDAARKAGLELIHVNQGFTRCNLLPVGNGFITSDSGICKVLQGYGIKILLIPPGSIALPGHDLGFIGGCAGSIGNTIVFNGDLSLHPECDEISAFIAHMGYGIKDFKSGMLTDIGSIIESNTIWDFNPLA